MNNFYARYEEGFGSGWIYNLGKTLSAIKRKCTRIANEAMADKIYIYNADGYKVAERWKTDGKWNDWFVYWFAMPKGVKNV